MSASIMCSNCGEEISNVTFSWGKKQWLWGLLSFLPLVFFLFFWNIWLFPDADFENEIRITLIETRTAEKDFDVLGKLENAGNRRWDSITVEAEFYDKDGKFLDETSEYISLSLSPGGEENFRVTLSNPMDEIREGDPKVVLKVTGANIDRF